MSIELPVANSSAQDMSSKQVLSTRPSLEKAPSIPLSKKSAFIKEASKPSTPPPWVSVPRSSLLRPLQQDRTEERPDENIPDPFAPLRKTFVTLPLRAWGESAQLYGKSKNTLYEARENRYKTSSRKRSKVKGEDTPSSRDTPRSLSRKKVSPPGFRRASRRLSALFQLREKDSIPALTQELLQHQEEIRNVQETRTERVEAAPPGGVAFLARTLEQKKRVPEQESRNPEQIMRESRTASKARSTDSTKNWGLRLVDKNKTLNGHRLEDDRLEETIEKQDRKVMSEARLDKSKRNVDEHECSWRRMVMDVRGGSSGCNHNEAVNLGIMGITIILHFDEKEDMILKAGSWNSTGEPTVLR